MVILKLKQASDFYYLQTKLSYLCIPQEMIVYLYKLDVQIYTFTTWNVDLDMELASEG